MSPLPKPKRIKKPTPKKSPSRPKPAVKSVPAARRQRRRQTLAASLLQGKTVTEVAKREGLSRSHVSREANAPETRLLMAELLANHRDQIERLVGISLLVVEDAFAAGKFMPSKEGDPVDLGADHFARLAAVKRLVEMISAARTDAVNQGAGLITWEMFLQLRERVQP